MIEALADAAPLAAAAREYLTAGLSIIALDGKKPNPAVHRHGLSEPISGVPETEEDERLLAWAFHPYEMGTPHGGHLGRTTGIGILVPPNMAVADIDSDEAADQYMALAGELPVTPTARTRHGLHVWFLAPGMERTRWVGKLLLRGPGSYVAAPPSAHPEGGRYEWITPLTVNGVITGIDWLPDGIGQAMDAAEAVEQRAAIDRTPVTRMVIEDGQLFSRPVIDALVARVETAGIGERNNILAWAVMCARDEGVSREIAESMLGTAAVAAGLSDREVRTTIRAAFRRGPRAQV